MDPEKKVRQQLIDQLTGEENSKEELKSWTDQSPETKKVYSTIQKIWKAAGFISSMKKFDSSTAWSKVDTAIQQQATKRITMQKAVYALSGMAASFLIILGLAFYTGLFSFHPNQMKLSTAYGSRAELTLPDGSEVILNSGSSIQYQSNKIEGIRDVSFSGEAYFKVAKSNTPFVIRTPGGMELKVLGTEFNLSTYSEDQFVETTLIEGKVELSSPNGKILMLEPGQMASFHQVTKKLVYRTGIAAHELGWLNHKIYLDNMSLTNLAKRLERQFDVQIQIIPAEIGQDIHYTGVLEENTITDILTALSELSDINYAMNGKNIAIRKK